MPEGQLTNLMIDPSTGGIITPGVMVNDNFETDKLNNYVSFHTGNKANATVEGGRLRNWTTQVMTFRNNRTFFRGNSLVNLWPASGGGITNWAVNLFPKVLDTNNWLLIQAFGQTGSATGLIVAYRMINGIAARLDAGDLIGPVAGDASDWWIVGRIGRFKQQTRLVIQTYQSPPYMFFPPYQVREYMLPDTRFSNVKGYSAIGLDPLQTAVFSDASIGEWIVTDDTVQTVF